jgi:hypothetical protein
MVTPTGDGLAEELPAVHHIGKGMVGIQWWRDAGRAGHAPSARVILRRSPEGLDL